MTAIEVAAVESPRLEALVRHRVGWQIDALEVLLDGRGVTLRGHALCAFARCRAAQEAERLAGRPVVANDIRVD
jgi:hypothetical protein